MRQELRRHWLVIKGAPILTWAYVLTKCGPGTVHSLENVRLTKCVRRYYQESFNQWFFLGLFDDHRLFSPFVTAICQGILGSATPLWPNFRPKIRQRDATVAGKVRARDTTLAGKYRLMLA